MNTERADIYERITNQIIAALETCATDGNTWKRPWHSPDMANVIPKNAKTGTQYRGVNVLALWATAQERGYLNGLWATFRQWQELGAQVRKGEKSCPVVFWGTVEKKSKAESKEHSDAGDDMSGRDTALFAKTYHVFNVSQVNGYEEIQPEPLAEDRIDNAEQFFSFVGVKIREAAKAFYVPSEDIVYMPPFAAFFSKEGYYGTLAHEVTHWTGHQSRLHRDMSGRFGDEGYAMEELVAELGAAFLCAQLGVSAEPREDHAAYIHCWLKVLKHDKRAVFTAASNAQKAVDYMQFLATRSADSVIDTMSDLTYTDATV